MLITNFLIVYAMRIKTSIDGLIKNAMKKPTFAETIKASYLDFYI